MEVRRVMKHIKRILKFLSKYGDSSDWFFLFQSLIQFLHQLDLETDLLAMKHISLHQNTHQYHMMQMSLNILQPLFSLHNRCNLQE
jgi:hypothetical protein